MVAMIYEPLAGPVHFRGAKWVTAFIGGDLADRLEIAPWDETDDPYALLRRRVSPHALRAEASNSASAKYCSARR